MKLFKGLVWFGIISIVTISCFAETIKKLDDNTARITSTIMSISDQTYEKVESDLAQAKAQLIQVKDENLRKESGIQSTIDLLKARKAEFDKQGIKKKAEVIE